MKFILEVELPDWVNLKTQTLMLLADQEMVAIRYPRESVKVKVKRCNQCGECCMDNPGTVFGTDSEGKCKALMKSGKMWPCTAGKDKPFHCLPDPIDPDYGCVIEYDSDMGRLIVED